MNNSVTAIIVDDEESARNVLTNLLTEFCPQIKIITTCNNVIDSVEAIKKHNPNLVFLDIEMPNYAGYEIVSFFEKVNFEIIFVTAYDKYAIKAFEVSAIDYLLKPVEIEQLERATNRAISRMELKQNNRNYKVLKENFETKKAKKIVVGEGDKQEVILINSIVIIEAKESYSLVYTQKGSFLVTKNLKHFETILEDNNLFFRTHKSWIINKSFLIKFSKSTLELEMTNNIIAKLSKHRRADFKAFIVA